MKVRELLARLQRENPEDEVFVLRGKETVAQKVFFANAGAVKTEEQGGWYGGVVILTDEHLLDD